MGCIGSHETERGMIITRFKRAQMIVMVRTGGLCWRQTSGLASSRPPAPGHHNHLSRVGPLCGRLFQNPSNCSNTKQLSFAHPLLFKWWFRVILGAWTATQGVSLGTGGGGKEVTRTEVRCHKSEVEATSTSNDSANSDTLYCYV